jgi:hypothetical protein
MPIPDWLVYRMPVERFDPDWYLRTYPDIAATGQDPIEHYLMYGRSEGRSPSEDVWRLRELAAEAFDEVWYVHRYPDVGRAGFDPVTHYLIYGRKEGRAPTLAHARANAWVQSFGEH